MALSDTDRRRFFLATVVTLLALPALWWANEANRGGAPGIATVGVAIGDDETTSDTAEPAAGAVSDDAGEIEPVFLDGASGEVGAGLAEIAVPAAPAIERIRANATFRSTTPARSICLVPGVTNGRPVTVVNLDTNRSVQCTTAVAPGAPGDQIVLHTDLFSQIADLTDAPVPVEIRQ